jgi:hypothetical protein
MNTSHTALRLEEAVRTRGAQPPQQPKGPPMSYAAAFAYASKSLLSDPYAPARPHRKVRNRRRRVRIGLLPRGSR